MVLAWLVFGGFSSQFQSRLAEVQKNDNASFLPASAESTEATNLQATFSDKRVLPAVLVFERPTGLTMTDQNALQERLVQLGALPGVNGQITPPDLAKDGKAVQAVAALDAQDGAKLARTIAELREVIGKNLPAGLNAYITGPAGLLGDLADIFKGIDELLLGVTAAVVALILVVVYRSPLLPILVLASAGLALASSTFVVYELAANEVLTLSGSSQGILFILVFGAATDYALLLVARYREELRRHASPYVAMGRAYRASFEPILASAGTVVLGLMCLLLSELNSNRGLGPVAATGIVMSLLASLTFLPAVLVIFGRVAFWPFRPMAVTGKHAKVPSDVEQHGSWARVAAGVGNRPRLTWMLTALVLLGGAALLPQFKSAGTSQTDLFLTKVESVTGQEALSAHFPGGIGSPAAIIANAQAAPAVMAAARVPGIADVTLGFDLPPGAPPPADVSQLKPKVVNGKVQIFATFAAPADSPESVATVRTLREAVHRVPGAEAKVGGFTALQYDVQEASSRDRWVIIPAVLVVIVLVLALLLRSLLAPLLLTATVVLSFAATLGVSGLIFEHLLGWGGADPSVPLFAFVFLVALGIDYNIFLMTRVREETVKHGTVTGTLRGLTVTGGVITSAGVVLAATFAALAVLPLLFLAQLAFLVAFGVLLDTLVVRSLLVPALTIHIGRSVWWPGRLWRAEPPRRRDDDEPGG
ncbi:efflux RND transporter permease subunit [Allokutzneria sp. A3M-2-11 16]|uniref:MMPL family transporter n=1 Tax=Allokutzneria sp. A3M-2-11 16 TaxID=2962043 RepID=UPI0020B77436|nr:efflux RND transporter permease subunit [Allokutzneria sp. A3M-2-11 16]MCP3803649.1 efflux RND transporter permease subunit [Allokutzneria sp. A3M-2-11 16]